MGTEPVLFKAEDPNFKLLSKDLSLSKTPAKTDNQSNDILGEPSVEPSTEDLVARLSLGKAPVTADKLEQRESLMAKLGAWEPPKNFNDGSSNHLDPRKYYTGPPLAELNLKKWAKNSRRQRRMVMLRTI
jgi:hypothetical protein